MKVEILKFKNVCLLAIALFFVNAYGWAKDVEKSKSFTHSEKFEDGGQLNLRAHSDVIITTWDKNEVKVIATLRVEAEDEKDIDALFADLKFLPKSSENEMDLSNAIQINKRADFEIKPFLRINTGDRVKVELSNGDKIKLKKYQVKYEIITPVKTRMNLKVSYGNVHIVGDLMGESVFDFHSSKFSAENLGRARISMKYGEVALKTMTDGKISLFEGELELLKARELEINSKYSKLSIDKATRIKLLSFEDKVKIGKIDELKSNMKYGDLMIAEGRLLNLAESYEVDAQIGKADQLKSSSSKYSDYQIGQVTDLLFSQTFEDKLTVKSVERLKIDGKYGKVNVEKLGISCEIRGFETDVNIAAISPDFRQISMDGKYMDIQLQLPAKAFTFQSKITYGGVEYNSADYNLINSSKQGETNTLELKRKGSEGNSGAARVSVLGYESEVKLN